MSGERHWGVVGGGMLGMTIAMRLRQAGHRVTLLEGADQLGGLAATWQLDDIVWDKHYHVVLLSDSYLRTVLDELGLGDHMHWVETKTGCYTDGELYSVSNTVEFLRFPPLRLIDKLRLGWTIFIASRITNWRSLEETGVEEWLVRHSGRRTFERFWKPLLRSKLGDNYRIASAAFIWAIIQRLYAARHSGLKREMFGYVDGGYATVLRRFGEHLESLGVETQLGRRADRIHRDGDRVLVDIGDERLAFDEVVATPASPIAAQLIDGLDDTERSKMNGVTYQGIICASVLLSQPLADYYVTNITDSWVPFTGVIEMSALVDRRFFGGRSLVYLPRYTTQDDPAGGWSDEEVEERFLGALDRMYPSFDRSQVEAFQISRVRYVLPVSTLGYSKSVPDPVTSVAGVYAINSSQILNGTLNVNETVQLAENAMETLLRDSPSGREGAGSTKEDSRT
jgi:protoporphyrinogen oxidase